MCSYKYSHCDVMQCVLCVVYVITIFESHSIVPDHSDICGYKGCCVSVCKKDSWSNPKKLGNYYCRLMRRRIKVADPRIFKQ